MKKILPLIVISFVMMPIWLCGQEPQNEKFLTITGRLDTIYNKKEEDKKEKQKKESIITPVNNTVDSTYRVSKARHFPDVSDYYSECYENITTKYGLWQGIGKPLNYDQICHTSYYYKLLRPKDAPRNSPFTHMQIVNSHGRLTTNQSYGPIMANPFVSDDDMSRDWQKKLITVCQAEQIIDQGSLLQENLYDKDGRLVLQYNLTNTKNNCVMGHYTDPNGSLAHLRTDEEAAYISIEYDKNGYIARVTFTDKNGYLKRNGDGVFVQLFENDNHGNRISAKSANALGQPMIDNWGNCGWSYTYDKQGRVEKITCIDDNGKPMRMPATKSNNEDVWNVWIIKYTYNKYGNRLARSFYDLDDNADVNSLGVHTIVYTYDTHGNAESCHAEDLNHNLVNYEKDLAKWERKYDKDGNLLLEVRRNKDGLFSENYGDNNDQDNNGCVKIYDYSQGKIIMSKNYETTDGNDTILTVKKVFHPDADTLWFFKDSYNIIKKYDQNHRVISYAYYDMKYNPICKKIGYYEDDATYNYSYQWHKCVCDYIESPKYSTTIVQYFDTIGLPADMQLSNNWAMYNKTITEVDPITRTEIYSEWNGDKLLKKYQNTWDENYQHPITLGFYDIMGCRGRTSMTNGFYYETERFLDSRGNIIVWRSLNEFGEPAYTQFGDWDDAEIYSYYVSGDSYYSEDDVDILFYSSDELKEFKDSLNKEFCIELTDSCAYRYGLRTGDVIVRYGDWYCVEPQRGSINDSRNLLCYETALKANTTKTVTVMRHDPATKTSKLIDFELPAGTPQQLGFLYHINYLTTREADRYNQVIADSKKFEGIDTEDKNENNDRIYFIYPHKIGDNKDKKVFVDGFRENAIILGWKAYADDDAYFFSCNNKYKDMDSVFTREYDFVALYYTDDCRSVKKYIFENNNFLKSVSIKEMRITDGSMVYSLADSLQMVFNEEQLRYNTSLTPHDAAQKLVDLGAKRESNDVVKDLSDLGLGDVTAYEVVFFDKEDLSYEESFLVNNILLNIDYSDYILIDPSENIYGRVNKSGLNEIAGHSIDDELIVFLYGDLKYDTIYAAELTVNEDINPSVNKGNYVIIQCGNWHFGMDAVTLNNIIDNKDEISQITIAKINENKGKYSLSRCVTVTMSCADWKKVDFEWREVPDPILFEAVKLVKRLK